MSAAIARVLLDYAKNFIKLPRPAVDMLCGAPITLTVLVLIISRARWTPGSVLRGDHGVVDLDVGQAMIGRDEIAKLCNTSASKARTAILRLRQLGYIATRSTSKGMIVTVLGYGGNADESDNESPTESPGNRHQDRQAIANESPTESPLTRREEGKKSKREQGKGAADAARALPVDALRLAGVLFDQIARTIPRTKIASATTEAREQTVRAWAQDIDKLSRIDGIPHEDIAATILWLPSDDFWCGNILSGKKLREKYDQLTAKRSQKRGNNSKAPAMPTATDYATVPDFMNTGAS
ncbi:MAG: hypothetical protein M3619_04520 [Myxococcota bacterium]|nr:hypothetical protein [Myxococcota bacterium]